MTSIEESGCVAIEGWRGSEEGGRDCAAVGGGLGDVGGDVSGEVEERRRWG